MKGACPDGFIEGNLIFWGMSSSKETLIAKGYTLDLESKNSLSIRALNDLKNQIGLLLRGIQGEYAMQLQWHVDSDYGQLLDKYEKDSSQSTDPWTHYVRSEVSSRYHDLGQFNKLRREKLALFVTKKINTEVSGKALHGILKSTEYEIDIKMRAISGGMSLVDFKAIEGKDYFEYFRTFLNPSTGHIDIGTDWVDPHASIMANSLNSDGVCTRDGCEVFFKMDDHYHALLILNRWPSTSHPLITSHLTEALSSDYRITQNIYPLDVMKEIKREEKELEKLQKNQASSGKESMLVTINKKREAITALMDGRTHPFEVMTIFRVWATSVDALTAKTAALKTSINGMGGASYHHVSQEAQAVKIFYETIPGWTNGDRPAWRIYAENKYLADLMPFSSTFLGTTTPECIYDGNSGNLVGIECFRNGTPQHSVLLGMTGAGKSVAMFDLLSQTECFYDFTAIIEEGNSYGVYTELMGSEPIIIRPDSSITINYFETHGLPLTDEHISSASSLCLKMVGSNSNEDINLKRLAIFSEYINELYFNVFEEWKRGNQEKYLIILTRAYAIDRFLNDKENSLSLTEAFLHFKDLEDTDPKKYAQLLGNHSKEDLVKFEGNYKKSKILRNLTYAYFKSEDYPTHATLVDMMKHFHFDHHSTEEVGHLATLLTSWTADGGSYGALFDGQTNIEISGKIAHFELGMIPESASAMKEAAGFMISNWIRQHIMKLPRASRKRLIFEEVSRFLNISGGDKILAESYAQLRKFGCWVCCVTQQYSQLKQSALRPVIFGNSKLFFIMKQNDKKDLEDIAEAIGLPERAVEEIQTYTLPEHQIGAEKASYMMVYSIGGRINSCGTAKIVAPKALVYAASSNGDVFDSRMKNLKNHPNLIEGILHESSKPNVIST